MSDLKYCQGTECHTYLTQDRVKGTKGNKTNQTRTHHDVHNGNGNFCSIRCQDDWFRTQGDQAIDHFGRLTKPKHLREENAWHKDYDWRASPDDSHRYYFVNSITKERRPLTESQYDDNNYTLNIS